MDYATSYTHFCGTLSSMTTLTLSKDEDGPVIAVRSKEVDGAVVVHQLGREHTALRVIALTREAVDWIEASLVVVREQFLADSQGLAHPLYRYLAMVLDTTTTLGYLGDCRLLLNQIERVKKTHFDEAHLLTQQWRIPAEVQLQVLDRTAAAELTDDAVRDRRAFPCQFRGTEIPVSCVELVRFSSQNRFLPDEWVVVRHEEKFCLGRVVKTLDSNCLVGGVWEWARKDFMHIVRRDVRVDIGARKPTLHYSYGEMLQIGKLPKDQLASLKPIIWQHRRSVM
jgi:hypothetical protein